MVHSPRPKHKTYSPRDTKKMVIAFFLSERRENGGTVENIQTHFMKMHWTTKYDDIKSTLEEMIEDNWVVYEPLPYYKNKGAYKIRSEGLLVVDTIRNLREGHNPLLCLKVFRDVISEW
jgi:hypothetical protein